MKPIDDPPKAPDQQIFDHLVSLHSLDTDAVEILVMLGLLWNASVASVPVVTPWPLFAQWKTL